MKTSIPKILILCLVFSSYHLSMAQNLPPMLRWANSIGNTGSEKINSTIIDGGGFTIITGSFQGTVDFDPSPSTASNLTSGGGEDMFIAKYTNDGTLVWAKRIGGTSNDGANDVCTDLSGNIYVTGYFGGISIDFGGQIASANGTGKTNIFWAKYDPSGNCSFVNVIGLGNVLDDAGTGIVWISNNIYITGYFSGITVDFGAGNTYSSNGQYDIFLAKYTDTGIISWAKGIGGPNNDYGKEIDAETTNVYITGAFNGTNVDFNPPSGTTFQKLTTVGGGDIFLASYNNTGALRFISGIGSTSDDVGYGVKCSPNNSGTIYLTGNFQGTADFDPGAGFAYRTSNGATDIFLASYNISDGGLQNAINIGGTGSDEGISLSVDNSTSNTQKYVYLTGNLRSSNVDFDPSAITRNFSSQGSSDIFFSKYRDNVTSFEHHWTRTIGGTGDDISKQIFVNRDQCLIGGYFISSSIDADPSPNTLNLNNAGLEDGLFGMYFNWQVVLNSADNGSGSFRQAITDLNDYSSTSGAVPVCFDITGAGPFLISLASNLPSINSPAFIDGYTQFGSATATSSTPATLKIQIDGGGTANGLNFTGNAYKSVVRGLCLSNMNGTSAITSTLTGNSSLRIEGNYIGTNISGTSLASNSGGIFLSSGNGNIIGGKQPSQRNVIATSGNAGLIVGSNNNTIIGNYFGVKADNTGTLSISGNAIKFQASANTNNRVGGINPGEGNIIAQSSLNGINLTDATITQVVIRGNSIYCNGAGSNLGINLNGGNGNLAAPSITTAYPTLISGSGVIAGDSIDVFRDNSGCTPSQGKEYIGTAVATGTTWSLSTFSTSLALNDNITAILTRNNVSSAFSSSSMVVSVPVSKPSAQPTNLVLQLPNCSSVTGTFTANATATTNTGGYLILRRTSGTSAAPPLDGTVYTAGSVFSGQTVIAVNTATITTFSDASTNISTNYIYDIYAFNGSGTSIVYLSSNPLSGNITTPSNIASSAPAAPSSFNSDISSGKLRVDLTWKDNANNESGFEVERSDNDNTKYVKIASVPTDTVSYSDSKIQAGISYYYRVRAVNCAGNSAYSAEVGVVIGILVTGINQQDFPEYFKVYPNPSNGIFNIETDKPFNLSGAFLINSSGMIISQFKTEQSENNNQLDLSQLSKGLYFLQIPNGNKEKMILKLIKE